MIIGRQMLIIFLYSTLTTSIICTACADCCQAEGYDSFSVGAVVSHQSSLVPSLLCPAPGALSLAGYVIGLSPSCLQL